jgi:uncharacterized membrane-anchored protein
MKTLTDLLTTDYGLMSAGVIAFMMGMAAYLGYYFVSHMHADEQRPHPPSTR